MFNCRPVFPRPIYCPLIVRSQNNIVNPVITNQFGFFNNTNPGAIETESIIPVTLVVGRGTNITQSTTTAGAVTLLPGTYEVSYMANGELSAGGTLSVELELNGVDVPGSALTDSGTAGDEVTVGQTMIINVPATSTLELINNSAETVTFTNASITINRL